MHVSSYFNASRRFPSLVHCVRRLLVPFRDRTSSGRLANDRVNKGNKFHRRHPAILSENKRIFTRRANDNFQPGVTLLCSVSLKLDSYKFWKFETCRGYLTMAFSVISLWEDDTF